MRFGDALLRSHRSLFVIGTTVLAIGAALVASNVHSVGNWTMLIGGGGLMYSGDVCSELERDARRLAQSTGYEHARARADVFTWNTPRHFLFTLLLSLLLICSSLAIKAS